MLGHSLARPDRARLERDVRRIAVPRHPVSSRHALLDIEEFVAGEMTAAGLAVERHDFEYRGRRFNNLVGSREGLLPSRPKLVVGAHFDSVSRSPGADDNASGVAALLEIARVLRGAPLSAPVEFVGFNLEEVQHLVPPTYRIGSRAYVADLARRGVRVQGAFVLEMVGFTGPRQTIPAAVQLVKQVPRVGNFLAAVGDGASEPLLAATERAARNVVPLVTLSVPLKGYLVPDTRRSDNARFWDAGIPALMVTDTADLRNPNYHRESDTPETLDYDFLAATVRVVAGAVAELAG